jgi:signal transduction histidine kinase
MLYTVLKRLWLELLSAQVNGRLAQLHLSQQRLQRYELFYKHDLKNLAQFLSLLSAQLRRVGSEQQAQALVVRLNRLLPALEQRAGRILKHLSSRERSGWEALEVVDLAQRIYLVAQELELPVTICGSAHLAVEEAAFEQGLQGVLENFRHHQYGGEVQVSIRTVPGKVEIIFTSERMTGLDEKRRVRMFEPFWTTSESGMGLGLYIARQSFQQACGGQLEAVVLDEEAGQWGFRVSCPRVEPVQ